MPQHALPIRGTFNVFVLSSYLYELSETQTLLSHISMNERTLAIQRSRRSILAPPCPLQKCLHSNARRPTASPTFFPNTQTPQTWHYSTFICLCRAIWNFAINKIDRWRRINSQQPIFAFRTMACIQLESRRVTPAPEGGHLQLSIRSYHIFCFQPKRWIVM